MIAHQIGERLCQLLTCFKPAVRTFDLHTLRLADYETAEQAHF